MAKADPGVTTSDVLAGDGPGTNLAAQHEGFRDQAVAAQQEELAKQNAANTGGYVPPADYAKRHDIPSDDHPSRANEARRGVEREDSDKARRDAVAKHGVGVDLNAKDPVDAPKPAISPPPSPPDQTPPDQRRTSAHEQKP